MKRITIFSLALPLISSVVHAGPLTPAAVSLDIDTYGAKSTVANLDRTGRFGRILDRIAAGQSEWIQLAPRLAKGTDAGNSAELTIALAQALPKNPDAVLTVLDGTPITNFDAVCGVPFIEPSPDDVLTYLGSTIAAVKSAQKSVHTNSKAACLVALERAKADSQTLR
ncbi:hypothetical protein GCM10027093_01710 [Paraburkholderia jirisanensis]